jgi:hypothetical protein
MPRRRIAAGASTCCTDDELVLCPDILRCCVWMTNDNARSGVPTRYHTQAKRMKVRHGNDDLAIVLASTESLKTSSSMSSTFAPLATDASSRATPKEQQALERADVRARCSR